VWTAAACRAIPTGPPPDGQLSYHVAGAWAAEFPPGARDLRRWEVPVPGLRRWEFLPGGWGGVTKGKKNLKGRPWVDIIHSTGLSFPGATRASRCERTPIDYSSTESGRKRRPQAALRGVIVLSRRLWPLGAAASDDALERATSTHDREDILCDANGWPSVRASPWKAFTRHRGDCRRHQPFCLLGCVGRHGDATDRHRARASRSSRGQ